MNNKLALVLTKRGLITGVTEVEALYQTTTLGVVSTTIAKGEFTVCGYRIDDSGHVIFNVRSIHKGEYYEVPSENILKIDGMEPTRYANVYNINCDGTNGAPEKRRGRKPKKRCVGGTNEIAY